MSVNYSLFNRCNDWQIDHHQWKKMVRVSFTCMSLLPFDHVCIANLLKNFVTVPDTALKKLSPFQFGVHRYQKRCETLAVTICFKCSHHPAKLDRVQFQHRWAWERSDHLDAGGAIERFPIAAPLPTPQGLCRSGVCLLGGRWQVPGGVRQPTP